MSLFTPLAYYQQVVATSGGGYDPDAQAFITATGISGTNATAINQLVLDLKAGGFWTGLLAIYPMVGGTSTTCKYNLKNPLDTNAAFRLSFGGTWTFSDAGGAKPNGASGTYADTFLIPNTSLSATNGHISYYSLTNSNTGGGAVEMGVDGGGGEINLAAAYGNTFYAFWAANGGGSGNTNSTGFYINNKNTNTQGWKNGTKVIDTGGGSTVPTYSIYLGAESSAGATNYRNSDRGCGYASIGATLSDPAAYSVIINTYNTTLGRNTY
jgi:hypothetical protein